MRCSLLHTLGRLATLGNVVTVAVLGCAGCGGTVAQDVFDDASADSSVDAGRDAPPGFDSPGPPSDVIVGHDTYPPPACAALSDPCFAAFAAQVEKAASCMGHPDTCATSGGTDASGCGHRVANPSGGSTCTWPDGTTLTESSSSGFAGNAAHEVCYKYTLTLVTTGVYDVDIGFGAAAGGGGDYVEELTDPGKPDETIVIKCSDGTKSRSFSQADLDACGIATVCCSDNTPATCK
jgi:hypothetical protein